MPITITGLPTRDIRFPTSKHLDGSDAMNPDPDYSAAYVVLRDGNYVPPTVPGYGITMKPESLDAYEYPQGSVWRDADSPD